MMLVVVGNTLAAMTDNARMMAKTVKAIFLVCMAPSFARFESFCPEIIVLRLSKKSTGEIAMQLQRLAAQKPQRNSESRLHAPMILSGPVARVAAEPGAQDL